jgi:hypothetical protein
MRLTEAKTSSENRLPVMISSISVAMISSSTPRVAPRNTGKTVCLFFHSNNFASFHFPEFRFFVHKLPVLPYYCHFSSKSMGVPDCQVFFLRHCPNYSTKNLLHDRRRRLRKEWMTMICSFGCVPAGDRIPVWQRTCRFQPL